MLPTLELVRPSVRTGFLLSALIIVAYLTGISAMAAPFSATCALLAILPKASFSAPKTLLWSHFICVGIGVVFLSLPLPSLVLVALSAWVSITLMVSLRVVHAPAVAHAVILSLGTQSVQNYAVCAMVTALGFAIFSHVSLMHYKPAVSGIHQ